MSEERPFLTHPHINENITKKGNFCEKIISFFVILQ